MHSPALQIFFGRDLNCVPIESVVFIKASIFRGDNGMLEIERDLAQRDKFISLVVRRLMNPRLDMALNVNGCCRRIDPADGYNDQRAKGPSTEHPDDEPF